MANKSLCEIYDLYNHGTWRTNETEREDLRWAITCKMGDIHTSNSAFVALDIMLGNLNCFNK